MTSKKSKRHSRFLGLDDAGHIGPLLNTEGSDVADGGGKLGERLQGMDGEEQIS